MTPRVSIITPLYNKGAYFAQTAESVLSQTMWDIEWLVIDDCSDDNGPELLENITDVRIRKFKNSENMGPSATRNRGLMEAIGEWVLFLDADDLIERDHLLSLTSSAVDCDIVAGGWIEKNATLSDEGTPKSPEEKKECISDSSIAFAPWAIHAAIVRRSICPQWVEKLDKMLGEDMAFWFQATRNRAIKIIDAQGAIYRRDTEKCRSGERNLEAWFKGVHAAVCENVAFQNQTAKVSAKQAQSLMRLYESIWKKSKREREPATADSALQEAQRWLAETKEDGKNDPFPIYARRKLGIRIFHSIFFCRQLLCAATFSQ